MPNIENLNAELKKLSDICLKLKPWVEQGLLDYRIMESEYSQQVERKEKLLKENIDATENIRKAVQAADMIIAEARKEDQKIRANINILWTKAQSKYQEVEKRIDAADRKVIKSMLGELAEVA